MFLWLVLFKQREDTQKRSATSLHNTPPVCIKCQLWERIHIWRMHQTCLKNDSSGGLQVWTWAGDIWQTHTYVFFYLSCMYIIIFIIIIVIREESPSLNFLFYLISHFWLFLASLPKQSPVFRCFFYLQYDRRMRGALISTVAFRSGTHVACFSGIRAGCLRELQHSPTIWSMQIRQIDGPRV